MNSTKRKLKTQISWSL